MRLSQGQAPTLHAYLLISLAAEQLNRVHDMFEFGALSPFDTMYHLHIHDEPRYYSMTHAEIRLAQNEKQEENIFMVIDEEFIKQEAAWLVAEMVEEDDIVNEQAVSTDDVWEILLHIKDIPLTMVNYDIANMDINEDLGNSGMEFPYNPRLHPQPEPYSTGLDIGEYRHSQAAYLTAEPGEWEEIDYAASGKQVMRLGGGGPSHPEKMYRLKAEVAEANGIKQEWAWGQFITEDRDGNKLPEGTLRLQQKYDTDFAWPPYKRVEGSL